jgi:anti-sigma regulatory factor (Ser/Thr protein kinase)
MDIFSKKSRWKIYLIAGGAVILLVSLFYTRYLSQMLGESERTKAENWALAQTQINDQENDLGDYTLQSEVIQSNKTIPVIILSDRGDIDGAANFGEGLDKDKEYLKKEIKNLKKEGVQPIKGEGYSIYYKESKVLRQLRFFPLIQLILIAAFVGFGYISFNSARRAEQNRVWVGMAKETAHQLGTPISAIIAWIEHLKVAIEEENEAHDILLELRKDVERLELVADRFSKIGSTPVLEAVNIYDELDQCRAYMQARAPRKVSFHFPEMVHKPLYVNLNQHLFDWVVENILRNAIDAMDGKGSISAEVYEEGETIAIDISDTGKGIPHSKFRTVFQPGYTTKKRGWGLGLSLAKRIIEEYHNGKIFVKRSEEGKGTTFTIRFPKHPAPEIVKQELVPSKAIG